MPREEKTTAVQAAPAFTAHDPAQPNTVLRNTETGLPFEAGVATVQTVTPTTIRRLMDGDLQQVAPAA